MPYIFKKDDVYRFADMVHGNVREKGNELFFEYCPYCEGGGHDKNTFSVNLDNGTFNCFRSSCGKQGHFVELARDFGFELEIERPKKQYRKIPQREIQVKPKAVEYLESRGISRAVTERYKITTQKNNEDVLVFPFYDENHVMVFVKYRNTKYNGTGNKEWCEKDTKPILFGMAQCEGFDGLVITEGQIDSLSVAECGIKNAVSVPTGALGFTWIANVWEWICKFKEIIVFGDFENGKMSLLDEIQKRIPVKVRAVRQSDYLGEKDANAILTKFGRQAILTAIQNAEVPPIRAVKQLADVEAVDIYKLPKIKTNIPEIDKIIGGLYFGNVTLLTGKRGEGKSTFMSQLIVEAIEQGYPSFVYSGELTDYHFKRWIDLQAAGPDNVTEETDEYGEKIYTLNDKVIEKINDWYRDMAFIYDNNSADEEELETLSETIEKAVRQYGIKLVCVDNLMTALDVGMNDDIYRAQSKFVKGLKQIAVKYDIAVVLVAHPRKGQKGKDEFQNDDIAGSGDISNRVDTVLCYARNYDQEAEYDGMLSVTKNRLTGKLTKKDFPVELFYSSSTKRITSVSTNRNKKYGWEKDYDKFESEYDTIPF